MKHLLSTALLCGISILGASAQSIIVTDKDGITHRFHADYVKDITFIKGEPVGEELKFDTLDVYSYGSKNEVLTFTAGQNTKVALNLYQPEALFLQAGEYNVGTTNDPYTIDKSSSDTKITIEGKEKTLESGSMTVTLEGEVYTFKLNFTFTDGESFAGSYTGELNTFGPVLNFALTGCKYVEVNNPAANGFYYGLNDENWKVEMRLELFNSGDTPNNGAYMFSNTAEEGTADSYVNLYSPYNTTTRFKEGIVNLSGAGAERTIEINGLLENGLRMKATWTGELPARPTVTPTADFNLAATSVFANVYNGTNTELTLSSEADPSTSLRLDMYQPDNWYLLPGTYTVDNACTDFTISTTYSNFSNDGIMYLFQSGQAIVALNGDVYTITADITGKNTNDNSIKTLHATYTGKLSCGPQNIEYELSNISYIDVKEPAENGFYYKVSDSGYGVEASIYIYGQGTTEPADGTYTFGDTMADGTATVSADLFRPVSANTKYKSGTVTLSTDGANRVMVIEGVLEYQNIPLKLTYTGTLPAREVKADYTFETTECMVNPYSTTNVGLVFSNPTDPSTSLKLDLYQNSTYYLAPGTYTVSESGTAGNIWGGTSNIGYACFSTADGTFALASGTVTIANAGNIYTITGLITLADGKVLNFKYDKLLPSFGPILNVTLSNCNNRNNNNAVANGHYYKLNDENYKMELNLDIFSEDEIPAPGTYTLTDTKVNGTASVAVDLYSPYNENNNVLTDGTVTVAKEGDDTVITITGRLSKVNLDFNATYTGTLPAAN
ncbi:MAG: hypothetical protein NC402_07110 [Prevotella sp.]|nr:hypothetical protein [Prevotella sp.]MCM1075152.1 hypothetical protein [Ruminococcus sp.]